MAGLKKTPSKENAKGKIALALGLFALNIVALRVNTAAGLVVTAITGVIYANMVMAGQYKGASQQVVGRPLPPSRDARPGWFKRTLRRALEGPVRR